MSRLLSVSALDRYVVPIRHLHTAEFCFQMDNVDFKGNMKNDTLSTPQKQLIGAMLNSSGGVLSLVSKTDIDTLSLDSWVRQFNDMVKTFLPEGIFYSAIKVVHKTPPICYVYVLVKRSPELVTIDYGLYTRPSAETITVKDIRTSANIITATSEKVSVAGTPEWEYGRTMTLIEGPNVEFKFWNCKTPRDTIDRLHKDDKHRIQKCLLAFPNIPTGGRIYFGIQEDSKSNSFCIKGQCLEQSDEESFIDEVEKKLCHGTTGRPTVWGGTNKPPVRGTDWQILFEPVKNAPGTQRRMVIIVQVNHCPGGVFSQEPESYVVTDNGSVNRQTLEEWKQQILKEFAKSSSGDSRNTLPYQHRLQFDPRNTGNSHVPNLGANAEDNTNHDDVSAFLSDTIRLSWSEHSNDWKRSLRIYDTTNTDNKTHAIQNTLALRSPMRFIPEEDVLRHHGDVQFIGAYVEYIRKLHNGTESLGIASKKWLKCIAGAIAEPHYTIDVLSVDENCKMCLTFASKDSSTSNIQELYGFARVVGRKLKMRLIEIQVELGIEAVVPSIEVNIFTKEHSTKSDFLQDNCVKYFGCKKDRWNALQYSLGILLLQSNQQVNLRRRIGEEILIDLTYDQMKHILWIGIPRFTFIEGPPGSGKTLLGAYVCQKLFSKKDNVVLCLTSGLKAFFDSQDICETHLIPNEDALKVLLEHEGIIGRKCVIIDDCQNLKCGADTWNLLFESVRKEAGACLFLLADNYIQNFKYPENTTFIKSCLDKFTRSTGETYLERTLSDVHRNTQKVTSFMAASFPNQNIRCGHNQEGDDVEILRLHKISTFTSENELLQLVKGLTQTSKLLAGESKTYQAKEIVILVDGENPEKDIEMYRLLFETFLKEIHVHGSDIYPAYGLTIDHIDSFCGLDAKVIILVIPDDWPSETRSIANPKYKAFVASRAVYRMIFVTEVPFDHNTARYMNADKLPGIPRYPNSKGETPESNVGSRLKKSVLISCEELWQRSRDLTIVSISFMADGSVMYAGGEIKDDTGHAVTVGDCVLYKINRQGEHLTRIPYVPEVTNVCDVSVDKEERLLAVADYNTRDVIVIKDEGDGERIMFHPMTGELLRVIVKGQYLICTSPESLMMMKEGTALWETPLTLLPERPRRPFIAMDNNGHILVSNTSSRQVLVYTEAGDLVTTFPSEHLADPQGICVDSSGRVFVVDMAADVVSMFDIDGNFIQRIIEVNGRPVGIALYQDRFLAVGTIHDGLRLYELTWQ